MATPATKTASLAVYLTPGDIASSRGVNTSKVLGWIRTGELRAINVASRSGGVPRWRIAPADLDAFDAARAAVPSPAPVRRRRKATDCIEFF